MSKDDWALEKALDIVHRFGKLEPESLAASIALALKQEREIATLEMEAKYKHIPWPTENDIREYLQWSDNVSIEWIKKYVEERRK